MRTNIKEDCQTCLSVSLNGLCQMLKAMLGNINQGKCRNPVGNYMLKINNRNTRTRCEICSKLTIRKPEQRQWCHSGVFIVNLEHIPHLVLVFLLLTLSR